MTKKIYMHGSTRPRRTPRAELTGLFLTITITATLFPMNNAIAKAPSDWVDDITFAGQIEGGLNANVARPANGVNFGQFFGDRANQAQLNQLTLTVARAVDTTVIPPFLVGC